MAWSFGTKNMPKSLAEISGTKCYFGTQMYRPSVMNAILKSQQLQNQYDLKGLKVQSVFY